MSGGRLGDDAYVSSANEFQRLRAEICVSGPASTGENLLGMEIDACHYLGDPAYADEAPGLWHDMHVERSKGSDWLISGRASGSVDDAASIALALSQIWERHLRYGHKSVQTVISAPDSVALLAVTQIAAGGLWVTANVQVGLF